MICLEDEALSVGRDGSRETPAQSFVYGLGLWVVCDSRAHVLVNSAALFGVSLFSLPGDVDSFSRGAEGLQSHHWRQGEALSSEGCVPECGSQSLAPSSVGCSSNPLQPLLGCWVAVQELNLSYHNPKTSRNHIISYRSLLW